MKTKKPIASYEDMLDAKAKTTYEKDLDKEVQDIMNLRFDNSDLLKRLIKVLVGKNLITLKDFKRILGE